MRNGVEVLRIDRDAKTVRVRDLATRGEEYDESYDALALCPGRPPVRPPLPGIDLPRRSTCCAGSATWTSSRPRSTAAARRAGRRSRHAVVIGAGYIGLEMAENLHERGVQVEVVEMADQIMPPLDRELTTTMENYLRAHGVALHLGTPAAAFASPRTAGCGSS